MADLGGWMELNLELNRDSIHSSMHLHTCGKLIAISSLSSFLHSYVSWWDDEPILFQGQLLKFHLPGLENTVSLLCTTVRWSSLCNYFHYFHKPPWKYYSIQAINYIFISGVYQQRKDEILMNTFLLKESSCELDQLMKLVFIKLITMPKDGYSFSSNFFIFFKTFIHMI